MKQWIIDKKMQSTKEKTKWFVWDKNVDVVKCKSRLLRWILLLTVIITNGKNNDHLSEDRINQTCNEHAVAISKNNKSKTLINIAIDEYLLEANESTNTVDDNDKHSYNHNYYTSSSDSDIIDTNNYIVIIIAIRMIFPLKKKILLLGLKKNWLLLKN